MNNSFEVIAAMFLIRERNAHERGEYAAAVAYANAYDLLCYAVEDCDDCISQFDGYNEANDFINSHEHVSLWMMEDLFNDCKTNKGEK